MVSDAPDEKSRANFRVSIDIDSDLTWGELVDFVRVVETHGSMDRDEFVVMQTGPRGDVTLLAYVDSERLAPQAEPNARD